VFRVNYQASQCFLKLIILIQEKNKSCQFCEFVFDGTAYSIDWKRSDGHTAKRVATRQLRTI